MRSPDHIPKPSRRPDGRGVVRLSGKDHYLGRASDWPKAKRCPPPSVQGEYQALLARWLANGRNLPDDSADPTVNDVLLAYDKFAEVHYQREGRKNTQLVMIRHAMRIVRSLFGRTQARDFGPKKLKEVQQAMMAKGWSRNYVNEQTNRVRRGFKWAVGEELVPGDLFHALQAVPGLR